MTVKIYLADIAERLERASDGMEQYLNTADGTYEVLFDEPHDKSDEELAEKIENSGEYIRLPNQYDIHEYRIMQNFAFTLDDDEMQEYLLRALNGRRAYRRFKDALLDTDMAQDYYAFRSEALRHIAAEWCELHDIRYITEK